MNMKKKIVIEWDDKAITVNVTPDNAVRTSEVVGVLEWAKISMYINKKEVKK